MREIGRFIGNVLIVIWLVVAIFVTVCLLSYNEFMVASIGKTSFLIIDSDEMEPKYLEGDLLLVKRNSDRKINVGDEVFYYNTAKDSKVLVYHNVVEKKAELSVAETTYTLGGEKVSSEFIIGKTDTAKVYHGFGTLLGVFTSRWGYMFLVIFPTLFAIIYEILMIVETSHGLKTGRED